MIRPLVSHTLPTEAHDDPQASHSIEPFKSVPRSIDADHRNINIAAQTALDAEIEVSNLMHIDIGKVSLFEGDE